MSGAVLNVGLWVGEPAGRTVVAPRFVHLWVSQLPDMVVGAAGVWEAKHGEPTLVLPISRPLTIREGMALCAAFGQDAIAQATRTGGALIGPNASAWGAFEPSLFIRTDGTMAA